ncbi:membrane protein [Pseudoclavibacter endophyticus]|uniref:HlyC/CorC family transporter n=1 Tax=Pseudoclavibacter endophyticus TaxID=1778590 RepID=A0A6H9WQ85_9MICO|nr:hemolysin family protein [Pseudoclavibacter endophyticus]KAB1649861.1 HlyC/CorC family transporter [Pseudoclavibacter endophyticus]GGA59198.1 membrane protein [Pseudoclavibacter endophyticus]
MNEWLGLAVGILLTFGTGVFVGAEFSLVNLDRNELERNRDRGEKRLTPVINALKQTSTHLSSAQLGITLTTLLTGYTLEPAITSLLSDALIAVGIPESMMRAVGAVIAIVLATFLSMIVGELIPKNWALAIPKACAKVVVPLQNVFTLVFKPAVLVLNGSANWLIRRFGIEPKEELSGARTAEELSSLVRRSAVVGLLESDKAVLLSRTLRFSEHFATDVMTPRPQVRAIDVGDTVQALIELAASSGHSRFVVIEDGDIDDVVGIAHVKAAVAVPPERRARVPVGAIKQDALFVPETIALDALLGELRGGFQMAVVLDEYGGTAGVATLEDLVEEIVGELDDEHDAARPARVTTASEFRRNGIARFDAILRPDELRDQLGVTVPEDGPYETVAGFIVTELGRIAVVGDRVEVPQGVLVVEAMDGRRIDRVRFERAAAVPAGAAGGSGGDREPAARRGGKAVNGRG